MPFHPLSRLSSYLHIRSVDPIIFRSHFVLLFSPLSHSLSPPLHALTVAKINQNKINISAKRPDSVALQLLSLSFSQWGGVICVCERGCLVAVCSTSRPSVHPTPLLCAQHPSNCEGRHEGILKTVAAGEREREVTVSTLGTGKAHHPHTCRIMSYHHYTVPLSQSPRVHPLSTSHMHHLYIHHQVRRPECLSSSPLLLSSSSSSPTPSSSLSNTASNVAERAGQAPRHEQSNKHALRTSHL